MKAQTDDKEDEVVEIARALKGSRLNLLARADGRRQLPVRLNLPRQNGRRHLSVIRSSLSSDQPPPPLPTTTAGATPGMTNDRHAPGFQSILPVEVPKDFQPPVFRKSPADRDFLSRAVKEVEVFEALSAKQLRSLVLAFEKLDFAEHQVLLRQGEPGKHLYILHTGFVRFEVDGKIIRDAEADEIIQYGPGDYFGEMALLYNSTRAVSVVAQTAGTAFRVDFLSLRKMLRDRHVQSEQDKVALLQEAHFLKNVDTLILQKCAAALQPMRFQKGQIIFDADQRTPNRVYFIENGRYLMQDEGIGEKYEDIILTTGDCFGERSLLFEQPRPYRVTALTDGVAFGIGVETFRRTIGNLDRLNRVGRDVQTMGKIKTIRDSNFLHAELVGLAERISEVSIDSGTVLFTGGCEVESALYLVHKGKVVLTDIDTKRDVVVEAGGFFGNEQLETDARLVQEDGSAPDDILDRPTTTRVSYTAKVIEDCVIGKLTLKDCRDIVHTIKIGQVRRRNTRIYQSVMDDQITLASLTKHGILGAGSFGQVHLVSRQSKTYKTKNWYALKIQSKYQVVKNDNVERIMAEKDLLLSLRHPFIMKLRTTYQDRHLLYMLLDYYPGGMLLDRMKENDFEGLQEGHVAFYSACLFEAVKYLHGHGILHRDIKPENVLLDREGYPVLIDFGFAKRVETAGMSYTFLGTPMYMAPELILNKGHDFSCDLWSLGVLTYELLVGEAPFTRNAPSNLNQEQLFNLVCECDIDYDDLVCRAPDSAIALLQGILKLDPMERLRNLEIQKSQWFIQHNLDFGRLRRHEVLAPWIPDFDPNQEAKTTGLVESQTDDMTKKTFPSIEIIDDKKLKFF